MVVQKVFLFFVLFIYFFCTSVVCAPVDQGVVFTSTMSERDIEQRLAEHFPDSFICQHICFNKDIDISEYELTYLFDVSKDATVTRSDLKKGIVHLFKKNRFEKIHIQLLPVSGGITLQVTLTGFWTLGSCTISGFLRGKSTYRRAYTIERGDIFTIEKHQHAIGNIKRIMEEGGFFGYTLSDELRYDTAKKQVDVTMLLRLGKQFTIEQAALEITPDCHQADQASIETMERKYVQDIVSVPFAHHHINKVSLQLEQELHEKGFFHARVIVHKNIHVRRHTVKVVWEINLSKAKRFLFTGNIFFSEKQLLENLSHFGELVTRVKTAILIQELQSIYSSAGFLYALIEAHEDEGKVYFYINEGPRADVQKITTSDDEIVTAAADQFSASEQDCVMRFGKTIIRGYPGIPFYYIHRELPYKTGECWDPEKLQQTFSCLRTLDMFEHIYVRPEEPARVQEEKAVLIDIIAAPAYELLLRGGVGLQQVSKQSWFGKGLAYAAGGSFTVRNVTNHADVLLLNVDLAPSCHNASAAYTVPWLWHVPARTTTKIFTNKIEALACLSSRNQRWAARKEGFLVSLQRSYPGLDAHVNVGLEFVGLQLHCSPSTEPYLVCQASRVDRELLTQRVPYLFIEPSVVITNNIFSHDTPSEPLTFFSAKIGYPLGMVADAYFIKLLIEQSLFFPVKSILGAVRLRLGHIFTPCFSRLSPLERFFCGGMRSIRSYEADQCPPYGCFFDGGECRKIVQGGSTLAVLNAEVRIPLVRELTGVVFQDIGTLIGARVSDWNVRDNVLLATGFGLRYHTPIGPLSFDVGFRWRSKEEGLRYAWFLSFGETF